MNSDIELESELEDEWIKRARTDILAFAMLINTNYQINWHHRRIAAKLNAFVKGEIRFLMAFLPPRHGKSELISRFLPAFWHGIYPDDEIMAASYLDSLAADMTVDVQNIIDSPIYRKIFPETKIHKSGTRYSVGTRNSSEHHIVGRKGKYRGQGVGGSFTGKGANLCFPSGTLVSTRSGQIDISALKIGDQVWSYNHQSNKLELRPIVGLSHSLALEMVRIRTQSGRVIISTPDHPIFTEETGYRPAEDVLIGQLTWRLSSSQITSDQVCSVTKLNFLEVEVYDIEVEENHNFFAEDILVHNCIIDDPIKGREIADSETFRERLWNFYNNDLFSRLETNLKTGRLGQVLITLTRWHEDDLAGRLLELSKKDSNAVQWDILNYPAIRINKDDPTDPREVGDPLWKKKYGLDQLNQIKSTIGTRAWGSLYQQDPAPEGVGLFREEMFAYVDVPPEFDWSFIVADTSYKEKQENDFTVFACFGVVGDTLFVRDVWRRQIKSSDVEVPAEAFIRKFINYGYRGTWIEPKGHGIYLNQAFSKKALMIPSEDQMKSFYSDRRFDKVERANNVVPHLSHRRVYFSNLISEKEELVLECLRFPKARHDDFCFSSGTKIATQYGDKNIEDIRVGDLVLTPLGLSKVRWSGCTGKSEIIDKFNLKATPNHKVFSMNKYTFIPLDTIVDGLNNLSFKGMIKWKYQSVLNLMESSIPSWGRESIILAAQRPIKDDEVLKDFMWRFGNFTAKRKYQKAMSFTTLTAIAIITTIAIWSVYLISNTAKNILKHIHNAVAVLSRLNIWKLLELRPPNGIGQLRGKNGTRNMQKKLLKNCSLIGSMLVLFAPRNLLAGARELGSVALDVKGSKEGEMLNHLKVYALFAGKNFLLKRQFQEQKTEKPAQKHVKAKSGDQVSVYNLKTDAGVYYANGVLVSNCDTLIDALKIVYYRDIGILDVL